VSVLVGRSAPEFRTKAVKAGQIVDDFTLSQFSGKKYVVLFFYPADFTFVCPTELHEFQSKLHQFEELDAQVIGASTDSQFSHVAWLETPRKQGGIEGVTYPILSEFTKSISTDYDVLLPNGQALRATFIIDKQGVVQSQVVNNLDLGRNIDETLRTLQALQFTEEHGVVCPANWTEGAETMSADFDGLKAYFATR
jgi:peroxiredoxin 2/4